tara:strand:- start:7785 stop:8420 length:636 start_codon:yes stop_codon:yes gene_type:complete
MKNFSLIIKELQKQVPDDAVVWNTDPFKVLIATVLSQRTRDANTAKAAERLFSIYKNPEELAKAPVQKIEKLIKEAGFFRVKARRIKKISKELIEKYGGEVPSNRKELIVLPGVGSKTSACTLVYAFSKPAICVDTHVHRISNRIGIVDTKTPDQTEQQLEKVLPKKYWLKINHGMVRFGQNICRPIKPRHEKCALHQQCDFYNKQGKWKE